jgi:phospholipid/cholesterol/gamma-HCH transport system substrate-binding protein
MDTSVAINLKQAVVNIKLTSIRTASITGDLSSLIKDVQMGKGVLGTLITDESLEGKLKQTIVNIKFASDTLAYITGDLKSVSQRIKNGEGAIGTLLMDTNFRLNLSKSMENIENGTDGFNQNMEALKQSLFLRKYYKKKKNN